MGAYCPYQCKSLYNILPFSLLKSSLRCQLTNKDHLIFPLVTEVNIGSNISLCCIASGYPEPNIHWTKLKHRGNLLNAVNNTLTITGR